MLTKHAIELLGFKPIEPGNVIRASFSLLAAFEVRGITIAADDSVVVATTVIHEGAGAFAIGNSVNAITRELVGDIFVEDERSWQRDNRTDPPFLIVRIGPLDQEAASSGYWKHNESGGISTYDTFTGARERLARLEREMIPGLITSLTVSFSSLARPVAIRPITTAIAGLTDDGRRLHDTSFKISGSGYISARLTKSELERLITSGLENLGTTPDRVAEFFYQGSIEEDPLKSFLSYFISIEISTHKAFKKIEKGGFKVFAAALPSHVRDHGSEFIDRQQKSVANLSDRFILCGVCLWKSITDDDIREFRRLKRLRDDIAHGNKARVPVETVKAARALALRVLSESA